MIETPCLIEAPAQIAAVIHLTIPRANMPQMMGPAIEELLRAIAAQGLQPAGPLFAHHLTLSPEMFDFEVGFPLNAPIAPAGRVQPGQLPAAKVARTIYHGGYEGLFHAWAEFGVQTQTTLGPLLQQQGLEAAATLWEHYLVGPETDPDPSAWRTELNQPLRLKV